MAKTREILVYGSGAVGSVIAWRLSLNQQVRVSVVCRSNYEHVKRHGISLRTSLWGAGHFTPSRVCRHGAELRGIPFDYVVCANKMTSSSSSFDGLGSAVRRDTVLVSAQNGVDVERPLRHHFPQNRILSAVVNIACRQPEHGFIEQTTAISPFALLVGPYDMAGTNAFRPPTRQLDDFTTLDARFQSIADPRTARWNKQIWNGAFNPLAAIFDADTHELLDERRPYRHLILGIMRESYAVGRAWGAALKPEIIDKMLDLTMQCPKILPSMLQDMRAGRPMEVETLCGDIIALGRAAGIATPLISAVYDRVGRINQALQASTSDAFRPSPCSVEDLYSTTSTFQPSPIAPFEQEIVPTQALAMA